MTPAEWTIAVRGMSRRCWQRLPLLAREAEGAPRAAGPGWPWWLRGLWRELERVIADLALEVDRKCPLDKAIQYWTAAAAPAGLPRR
jgi:hypothetical protein